jgi:ElaB/YqjD/DUF883 family membrane-anchored ribosome-binding protein
MTERKELHGDPPIGGTTGDSASNGPDAMRAGTTDSGTAELHDRHQQSQDTVAARLGQVKDKAVQLKSSLADKLDTSADTIRQRSHSVPQLAPAIGKADAAVSEKVGRTGDALAARLEKTADWLRDGDVGAAIERQVQEHPGRTLLIALGVGYLVGRALKD